MTSGATEEGQVDIRNLHITGIRNSRKGVKETTQLILEGTIDESGPLGVVRENRVDLESVKLTHPEVTDALVFMDCRASVDYNKHRVTIRCVEVTDTSLGDTDSQAMLSAQASSILESSVKFYWHDNDNLHIGEHHGDVTFDLSWRGE